MAALDMHEQEQVDALKAWWKDNGKKVVIAAVLALVFGGGGFGWKYWQGQQQAQAAAMFEDFLTQLTNPNFQGSDGKKLDESADKIAEKFGTSIYAVRAKLMAAQMNIGSKNKDAATAQLQWVIDHADNDLRDAARLKLAGLQLDDKKYDAALALLNAKHPTAFDALYLDMKGDVLLAQGKKDEARTAYQEALSKAQSKPGSGFNFAQVVQLKLDGLGGEQAKNGAGK